MAHSHHEEIEDSQDNSASRGSWAFALLGYSIVVAFVFLCGVYVYRHRDNFGFLWEASLPETFVAGLCILASYLLNAFQMRLFLRKFNLHLGFIQLTALSTGTILGNLLIPMRGGTGGLAVYLKKVHGLDFQAFMAIYAGTALLVALINAALSLLGLALLAWIHGYTNPTLTTIAVGLFVVCLYVCVFPPPVRWGRRRGLLRMLFHAAHSWHVLTRDRRLLLLATASFLAISLSLTAAFYLIYRALGMPLSLSAVITTSSMGNLANLVPVTPGSLGIFDVVVIEIPQLFGLDPARSFAGTMVFRVLGFLWAFLLGIPGMVYILKQDRRRH